MIITWSEDLEIGDECIDMQHKELVEMFNALVAACSAGRGQDELERALDFLCEYTVKHFHDEEALQIKIDYPELMSHKQHHENFKVTVTNLIAMFKEGGPSLSILARLNIDVGEWLIKHIKHEDKKLEPYVKKYNL